MNPRFNLQERDFRVLLDLLNARIHELETPYPDETTRKELAELWDLRVVLQTESDYRYAEY